MTVFRTAFASAFITLISFSTGIACPWASSTYSATVPPDITLKVTFNDDCTAVKLIDSGGKSQNLATKASKKGWTVKYDTTTLIFGLKGKRLQGRRGGAQRTLRLKKL